MKTQAVTKSDVYSQGLKYTLNSDGKSYSVSDIGSCTDKDIIIPETYNNMPVTSIGKNAFIDRTGLTSITIPDSVTSIGDCVFQYCTGLTSITIPDSVTSIGDCAFSRCIGLTSITIPDSVTSIGDGAFRGCTRLTSITIPNSVTSIGDCAFEDCTGLHKNGIFKATDEDMCCRQFQYNLGEKFETTHASLCHSGFHFCTNAFDLLNYYSGEIGRTVRFFEVKVDKVTEERDSDSKRVCKEITFLREIKSYAELLN